MERRHRVIGVALLLVLALGLCVHYGAVYEARWPHPTGDQLAEDPDGWDGERVLLFGTVREVEDDRLVMAVETDAGEVARTVTVRGVDAEVDPGGIVQVYGTLSERGTVQRAESVVVVSESGSASLAKYLLSALGGVVTAGAFLRYWRIDPRGLRFVRRGAREGKNG